MPVFNNVISVRYSVKVSKQAERSIQQTISKRDLDTYKMAYRAFDKLKDGNIGVDEFVAGCRKMGLSMTEEEIETLFHSFDLKTYGSMDFGEFVRFMDHLRDRAGMALDFTRNLSKEVAAKRTDDAAWHEEEFWEDKWEGLKQEWGHYKRGFSLMTKQVDFARKRFLKVLEGRELSKYEQRKVGRAMKDLLRLVPLAGVGMAPGGSLLIAFAAKKFPTLLPTTFHIENMSQKRRNESVAMEVAAAIEEMERRLRAQSSDWKKTDEKFDLLLDKLASNCYTSVQDMFSGPGKQYVDNVNIGSKGMLDRLDGKWLFAIAAVFATDNQLIALRRTPEPILRAVVKRHVRRISEANDIINTSEGGTELTETSSAATKKKKGAVDMTDVGFPLSLQPEDLEFWVKLRTDRSVLLALLFQSREEVEKYNR